MVNRVIIVGNVGRDPEVRSTQGGLAVANFSVATSRRWNDKNGQKQEQTEWHSCQAWGKTAELIGQYVTKGRQIYVEGRLQTRSWEDRNTGEKKYKTEIVVEEWHLLGRDPNAQQAAGYGEDGGAPAGDDDEIPF